MKKTKNRKFPGVFLPGRMVRTMKLMTLLLVLQTFQVTAKGYSQENITFKILEPDTAGGGMYCKENGSGLHFRKEDEGIKG